MWCNEAMAIAILADCKKDSGFCTKSFDQILYSAALFHHTQDEPVKLYIYQSNGRMTCYNLEAYGLRASRRFNKS